MLILSSSSAPASSHDASKIDSDEVSEHRLTRRPIIHEQLPSSYSSFEALLHVVVNISGQVESAKVWNIESPGEKWATDEVEAAERLQRFRPFTRFGRRVRATFDDMVWLVPPIEWLSPHVAFPEISNWDTLRIKLTRSVCYGMCPAYSIEVHGNGEVLFAGKANVPTEGRSHGHVSRETVAKLVARFREVDYFSLKDEYVAMVTDNPTCTTSIQFDGVAKSVKDYVGFAAGMPEVVWQVEHDIDQIARDQKWIR